MIDLKQVVLDKIEQLGDKKAAEYFGKSPQAIYMWKNSGGAIPLAAVQMVLSEAENAPKTAPEPETVSEQPTSSPIEPIKQDLAPEVPPVFDGPTNPVPQTSLIEQKIMDDIFTRLDKIETWIRIQTDPDRQPLNTTRPAQNPAQAPQPMHRGIEVTSPDVVIDAPKEAPKLPANYGGGWNKPYEPKK